MNWTTDAFLKHLYQQADEARRDKAARAAQEEHRSALRSKLRMALGAFPSTDTPLHSELLETREYPDFILERVAYQTMEAVHVPVMVLKPKDGGAGPYPVVLACHGHGNGQRDAVGLDPDGNELEDPGIHNRFAVRLVRKGMAVVVPEIMGFGVRRMEGDLNNPKSGSSSCGTLASQLLMYGRTLAGMRVYEAMRALDYIESRADMDSKRIGTFGFSGGALIAAFTAALEEQRIRATVLCGWTNTFQGSIIAMNHCIDNYLPGILLDAEQPELTGLIAPRALFVESGEKDPIFPVEHVREAVGQLQGAFDASGAADRFGSDIFPGKHEISGRASIDWIAEQLRA